MNDQGPDQVADRVLSGMSAPLREFWTERHLCLLTTLRANGTPHVTAVGVVLDPEWSCAWVITRGHSLKARHVGAGDGSGGPAWVAAGQVQGPRWSSLEGTAVVCTEPEQVARAVEMYAGRYRRPKPNPERVALRITPSRVLASQSLRAG